ncbi:TPR repeat protein [Calothrix sp. NIES-4071]|nr:TPR repeat protein [Calothrix sp. NIES-4071]BAZ59663.1 TPR repeat protein [Calothrix sp. NIES-4105]
MARKWYLFLRYLQSVLRFWIKSPQQSAWKLLCTHIFNNDLFSPLCVLCVKVVYLFKEPQRSHNPEDFPQGRSQRKRRKRRKVTLRNLCVHSSLLRGVRGDLILLTLLMFALPSLANPHHTYTTPITQTQSITNQSQIDQGKLLYDAGRFSEAVQVLQQAVQEYQRNGEILKQAVTLGNLSLAYQQLGNWKQATEALNSSLRLQGAAADKNVFAQTLIIQGRLLFSTGQTDAALQTWRQAEKVFEKTGNKDGSLKARVNQAQSLQILGYYYNAVKLLREVNSSLHYQPDSIQKLVSLRSLGDALQLVGELEQSRIVLEQSLKVARNLSNNAEIATSLFSLGNHALFSQKPQQAIKYYQQTVDISSSPQIKVQALLNQLSLVIQAKNDTEATNLISVIESLLQQLSPSRAAIYARINFADSLMRSRRYMQRPSTVIATAIQIARSINDQTAYAYALGELALLYEKTQQYPEALKLTQKALVIAQAENIDDVITYQLQWQLGRLLRVQLDTKGAIASYEAAIETLSKLRSDLVAINQDVQFNFKENVEPVYRQLVALLLESQIPGRPDAKILDKARQHIEALQLAELDNYFREACLQGKKVILDKVVDQDNPNTAILYPIILADTLQVIVKIPKQQLKFYTTEVTTAEIETTVAQLRRDIIDPSAIESFKIQSQKLYTWLVKKIEPDLATSDVDTIVFIPDTLLRSIPFSALFDGKNYLIEKYAITMNAGLQLLDPQPLQRQQLNVLTAGLSQPPFPYKFAPLPGIKSELEQISKAGIKTTTLLDRQFTSKQLNNLVHDIPFNIVHLATHGIFSSRAEDTFILAADGPINVREFDNLLRSREQAHSRAVQLLVLSACQTAEGDKRAALGLAGVAIKAGARSTLASLWQIDDESTAIFVGNFYRELKAKVSKAAALRLAQLKLLNHPNYRAPGYWGAYVLIGNWL